MIVDATQMAQIDSKTISEHVKGEVLMETAGECVVQEILKRVLFKKNLYKNIYVFTGAGNNGGDGYVISKKLLKEKFNVKTISLVSEDKIKGDALFHLNKLLEVTPINIAQSIEEVKELVNEDGKCLIIDAIFGTGLTRKIEGFYADVINYINSLKGARVSVDIPSGVCAGSGRVLGTAVKSDLTVTFALPKIGQFIYPGKDLRGSLVVKDIGIPNEVVNEFEIKNTLITKNYASSLIKRREPNSHKYTYGLSVIISGSLGKAGAPVLVSKATMKAGGGLATLIVPDSVYTPIAAQSLEVMVEPIETVDGSISFESFVNTFEKLSKAKVVAIGPGVGINEEIANTLSYLLDQDKPLLIDADALRVLKPFKEDLKKSFAPRILTPHLGEFSYLLDEDITTVLNNKIELAQDFAKKYGVYLLLKGNDSLICCPDGSFSINSSGNPSMANAGQGDALCGFITGLISSGYETRSAIELACFLHGYAGDVLSRSIGPIGVLASDIIEFFPRAYFSISS